MNIINDQLYEELLDKALFIYQQVAEEWLADDPAYERLSRLASDPKLELCVSFESEPSYSAWQDTDLMPEDFSSEHLVEFTLFYAKSEDTEHQVQESIVKILLSADEDNDCCALQWFPD